MEANVLNFNYIAHRHVKKHRGKVSCETLPLHRFQMLLEAIICPS